MFCAPDFSHPIDQKRKDDSKKGLLLCSKQALIDGCMHPDCRVFTPVFLMGVPF